MRRRPFLTARRLSAGSLSSRKCNVLRMVPWATPSTWSPTTPLVSPSKSAGGRPHARSNSWASSIHPRFRSRSTDFRATSNFSGACSARLTSPAFLDDELDNTERISFVSRGIDTTFRYGCHLRRNRSWAHVTLASHSQRGVTSQNLAPKPGLSPCPIERKLSGHSPDDMLSRCHGAPPPNIDNPDRG